MYFILDLMFIFIQL